MNRRKLLSISLVICFFLVLTIAPEAKALSYTDTEFDFQSFTNDANSVSSLTNGLIQDCEDDLDDTDGWTKTSSGIVNRSSSNNYEGTYSANISATTDDHGVYKEFEVPSQSEWDDMWLSVWLSGADNNNNNNGYLVLKIECFEHNEQLMEYVLANSTTFDAEFQNGTGGQGPGFNIGTPIIQPTTQWSSSTGHGHIRVGDANDTVYIHRNITSDFYDSVGAEIGESTQLTIKLYTSANYILNMDALIISFHDTITPLPEPTVTGNAKGFYNESGLCLETGSDESAYARIDFDNFADRWDYGIQVTYSGTGTSTNISSSLNVDAAGWNDWNHTIATLGNDTFIYYTTNQSYSGENIDGRYIDIDCPASSSIIIQSLTIREGYPSGGGSEGGGGGGGGEAPATVATEVVSELTTPLIFGITYAHLLLFGMLGVVFARPYVKKKVHYRVPKQNLVFISGLSFIFIVFFWISLSAVYMESPAENVAEIFFPFYLVGLFGPAIVIFGTYRMKMQGIERPPNKFIFQSKEFGPSVIKGTILLTSVSFVLYYILNLITGFRADVFLVTQLPTQSLFAFQLGSSTSFFLHFVLPWVEEMCFRFLVPLMVAPYTDETQRAIISSVTFGAFHFYVAQTIGYAYFIYFAAGGFIFYSICYGTMWLEKYWKSMPSVMKFKGAGIMAAIIVHLVFNFMALYGSSLLQTAWVVEI